MTKRYKYQSVSKFKVCNNSNQCLGIFYKKKVKEKNNRLYLTVKENTNDKALDKTIKELKEQLADQVDIPADRQRLIYSGR